MAEDENKTAQAETLVRTHMLAAIGTGILPIPGLDIVLSSGVQFRLLRQLARLYGVEFSKQRGNMIVASLAGLSTTAAVSSLLKVIPGYGSALGAAGTAASAGATTYALGKVFIKHFESGGTFLTFDPEKAKEYYESQVKEGTESLQKDYTGIKP
jgi:uncharacterized protein (DUF697 family)